MNIEKIMDELDLAGFESAIAVATDAEVQSGAACGQLSIISD